MSFCQEIFRLFYRVKNENYNYYYILIELSSRESQYQVIKTIGVSQL